MPWLAPHCPLSPSTKEPEHGEACLLPSQVGSEASVLTSFPDCFLAVASEQTAYEPAGRAGRGGQAPAGSLGPQAEHRRVFFVQRWRARRGVH